MSRGPLTHRDLDVDVPPPSPLGRGLQLHTEDFAVNSEGVVGFWVREVRSTFFPSFLSSFLSPSLFSLFLLLTFLLFFFLSSTLLLSHSPPYLFRFPVSPRRKSLWSRTRTVSVVGPFGTRFEGKFVSFPCTLRSSGVGVAFLPSLLALGDVCVPSKVGRVGLCRYGRRTSLMVMGVIYMCDVLCGCMSVSTSL